MSGLGNQKQIFVNMENKTHSFMHDLVAGFGNEGNKQRISVTVEELKKNMLRNAETAGMEATGEHLFVLKSVFTDHRNVFITGDAGTGKTWFVKNLLMEELNNRGLNFSVTATTGIAGSHLEGKTLHSWAGVGLGPFFQPTQRPVDMDVRDVDRIFDDTIDQWETGPKVFPKAREGVRKRIRSCEVLLIDEISMCAGRAFLDFIDRFLKHVRGNDKPFGGIQVIAIGDFLQLPPVERSVGQHVDWSFLSRSWANAKFLPVEFTRVFRQDDAEFAGFLNRRRSGVPVLEAEADYVSQFVRTMTKEEALKASYLVPTNAKADAINQEILKVYPGPTTAILAQSTIHEHHLDRFNNAERIRDRILKGKPVRDVLNLRVGLPVLLTYNDPNGDFVNGTKGFVRTMVKHPTTEEILSVQVGIPLSERQLAVRMEGWEITPVAYRGPAPEMELVVNLGRRRYTQANNEDPEDMTDIQTNVEVDGVIQTLIKSMAKFPFLSQFPIIPASAITIHRSQGMSLDECVVDLHQTFSPGHAYVGLSRLRKASGLTLTSSNIPVMTDVYAMKFYEKLKEVREHNTIPLS